MYNQIKRKGIKKIKDSSVLIKSKNPSKPDKKNIPNEILAAFFSPNEVAYVFTPLLWSPKASQIPSARSCALSVKYMKITRINIF